MSFKLPLINDNISESDKKVLSEFILTTNRFTNGPKVREFEQVWSEWLGVKHSVMVNSGASANYITTAIVRELKGHSGEIIVPTIGWVSDIASVVNVGYTPVFVDVALDTMSIAYETIKEAITERTQAIVLVHALGFNGLNEEIIELAAQHDLLLIEDCCEAHGATYDSERVGTHGDMSCFSFYFGHHITTIEGGMVCTDSEEIYQLAKLFRSHGMTREASVEVRNRYSQPDLNPLFTFAVPGYNMRSTEVNAVLGLEQMKRLDNNIATRRRNLETWLGHLDPALYFINFQQVGNSNFALPLLLQPNNLAMGNVCHLLEREGVEYRLGTAGGGNQARQPWLKKFNHRISGELKNSNYIHKFGLYVGNHTELTSEQIIQLCGKLNQL